MSEIRTRPVTKEYAAGWDNMDWPSKCGGKEPVAPSVTAKEEEPADSIAEVGGSSPSRLTTRLEVNHD